ncbi:MAG TPA: hypothetical protein VD926_14220, partial [Acidimicrobiales bacterium]|nr:hypothetical protein [Acidimicrobiales bacterium]
MNPELAKFDQWLGEREQRKQVRVRSQEEIDADLARFDAWVGERQRANEEKPEDGPTPEIPFPGSNLGLRTPFGPLMAQGLPPLQGSKPTENEEQEQRVRQGRAPIETAEQAFGPFVGPASREGAAVLSGEKPLTLGGAAQIAAGAVPAGEFVTPILRQQEAMPGQVGDLVMPAEQAARRLRLGDTFGEVGSTLIRPSFGDEVRSGVKAAGEVGQQSGGEASLAPRAGSAWSKIRQGREESAAAARVPIATRLEGVRRAAVRALTDRAVDLSKFQQEARTALGRPLRADEMVLELSKMNPDMAARVRVDEELKPIVRAMGDDLDLVSDLLIARSNVDQAAAKGQARKFSGGVTGADSQQAIADMQQALGPRFAQVEQHADAITALYR